MSNDLHLEDYLIELSPTKDAIHVRHLPSGRSVELDPVAVETEVHASINRVPFAGTLEQRRNAVIVWMAAERLANA